MFGEIFQYKLFWWHTKKVSHCMLIQKDTFTERQKFLNIAHFQATSYNAEDSKG